MLPLTSPRPPHPPPVTQKARTARAARNNLLADTRATLLPVVHEASRLRLHRNSVQATLAATAQRAERQRAIHRAARARLNDVAAAAGAQRRKRNVMFHGIVDKVAVIREATDAAWYALARVERKRERECELERGGIGGDT